MSNMHNHDQKGFVSILSVIFFMLLMSVLTISFLRIMSDEQTQVINDDLGKGALASAESGVEDAKRGLVYCRGLSDPAARATCYQALNNRNCPGVFANTVEASGAANPIPAALALDKTAGDGSVRVGNPANNQRYTCVLTSLQTADVIGQASEEMGEFIPLRSTGTYNRLTVYWHQTSTDGTAALPGVADLNDNKRYPGWTNGIDRFVSALRLQLVDFRTNLTLTQMNDNSAGMFLMPNSSGGVANINVPTITTGWAPDKRVEVRCTAVQGYACSLTINLPANTPADNKDYYLLIKSVYGAPHYKLELSNGATPVVFDDVQPQVDSTGAAGDVFRRVISRVSYEHDAFNTSNALESGISLCKDFFATDDDSIFSACPTNVFLPGAGNVGVGGICDIDPASCSPGGGGGGGNTPAWDTTIVNLSNNPNATILGCTWSFGDGSPDEVYNTVAPGPPPARCIYQNQFKHTFPVDPAYDGKPDPPKKAYTVTLTMRLTTGNKVDSLIFYMPRYK